MCWCCWPKIIKISPCLSKLELAKLGAFFLRHSVYAKPHLWNSLSPSVCVLYQSVVSHSYPSSCFDPGLVVHFTCLMGSFILVSKPSLFHHSLGPISWNIDIWCLEVLTFEILASAADLASPAGFWVHYKIILLTYLLTYLLTIYNH